MSQENNSMITYSFKKKGKNLSIIISMLLLIFVNYSSAQMQWTVATNPAEFTGRSEHSSVVFKNKIWTITGYGTECKPLHDIWCSEDGITWTSAVDSVPFVMRVGIPCISFNGYLWALGGYNGL